MDLVTSSSGASPPSLIPEEWAIQQLKSHWPSLEILEVFPQKAPEMVSFKGLMPEVGEIGIRMLTVDPKDGAGSARLASAFHRAQALVGVENAFAIPTLQAGSISGCLVIVSGWKEGIPLPEYLEKEEVGFESALAMIDCLAQAFEIYHAAGWVHGQLRAESVLVTSPNEVTLSGNGFLDVVTGYVPDPLDTNRVYIAPERNGRETEPTTIVQDVYTVGVVAYEILTGDKPTGQFMKLPSQVTGAGNWLDDVILRSIHSKPDSRIQTLTEFRSEMASQTLRLMDLSKKEKEEEINRPSSQEVAGSTAMMRKPLYIFMGFALLMVSLAIWFGQTMYDNQQQVQLTTQQAMGLMAELMSSLDEGEEGFDAEAIVEELSKASPEIQHEALAEKVKELRKAGKHEDAMKLTQKMLDMNAGVEGPAIDAMKGLLADIGDSLESQKQLQREADKALANFDLEGEETALEKLFAESPEDPDTKRRLSQIPKYFTPTWEHVEDEMRRWNPEQKEWHITIHRDGTGLEVDISGHDTVHWIDGLADLPIDRLDLRHTKVQAIGAVTGMDLKALWCDHTEVNTIKGLENEPLEILGLTRTNVVDFQPLEEFAFLRTLRVDPKAGIATKLEMPYVGQAWENSFGQRFIPLSGSAYLVENREVTEFDYTQFILSERANELVVDAETELEKNATLMPILVNLPDALAFCQWITAREQEVGHLPKGAVYRLPEKREIERLLEQIRGVAAEDGAQTALGGEIQPVAEGPCLRGFFDVHDNAEEWTFDFKEKQLFRLRGDYPKGADAETLRGIRMVLDLREARYDKPPVTEIAAEEPEEEDGK